MCFDFGTPKIINFPFFPDGKLMVIGVPLFKPISTYKKQVFH